MSMHTQFKQLVYYQSYGKNVPKPKELQKWHISDLIYTLEHVKKRVQKFSLKARTSFRPVCTYIILDMQKKEASCDLDPNHCLHRLRILLALEFTSIHLGLCFEKVEASQIKIQIMCE